MKSKMKQILCSIFLLGSLLWYSSCNQAKPEDTETTEQPQPTHYLHEIYSDVMENKLPPLETKESGVMLAPGDKTPVKWLHRAPQDLVGKEVDLSVNVTAWDDGFSKEFVYCFRKLENGEMQLSVLYCKEPWRTDGIMLTMKTDYKNATELLGETEVWSGVVSSVNIIGMFDYLYPQNTVPLADQGVEQSTDGPICYGRIFFNKDAEMVERLCYSCDSIDEIGAFKNTFERFGVLA